MEVQGQQRKPQIYFVSDQEAAFNYHSGGRSALLI